MTRFILVLAVVLAALVGLDGSLAEREAARRQGTLRVAPLLTSAQIERLVVAGLALEFPGVDEELVFVRREGMWISSHHDAFGDGARIVELVEEMLAARGVERTRDPSRAATFGFGDETRIGVRLLDTKTETALALDVGASVPGTTPGCFVRRAGSSVILALDVDLRETLLAGAVPGLPPLLDRSVIPTGSASPWGPVSGIEIAGYATEVLGISSQPVETEQGTTIQWVVETASGTVPCGRLEGHFYAAFLRAVPYVRVYDRDPRSFSWRGLDAGSPAVTISFREGDAVRLRLGGETPEGFHYLLNETTGRLYGIEPEIVSLVFPPLEALTGDTGATIWDPYLQSEPFPR